MQWEWKCNIYNALSRHFLSGSYITHKFVTDTKQSYLLSIISFTVSNHFDLFHTAEAMATLHECLIKDIGKLCFSHCRTMKK